MKLNLDPELTDLVRRGRDLASEGKLTEARALLDNAWEMAESKDNLYRCTVAHYIGIVESDPQLKYSWNLKCLEFAERESADAVGGFYASIYGNLGYSSLELGNEEGSLRYYELAEEAAAKLGDDEYGQMVKNQIASMLERLRGSYRRAPAVDATIS